MTRQGPGTGTLLAYLDGELPSHESAALEARLETEPGLRADLERVRASVLSAREALARLDVPVRWPERRPWVEPAVSGEEKRSGVSRSARPWARAAMVALTLGLGAASALPGSPVRAWLAQGWERLAADRPSVEPPGPPSDPAPESPAGIAAGVTVEAQLGRVAVSLPSLPVGAEVVVRLTEAGPIWVRAGPDARYLTGSGTVVVHDPGPQTTIILPRGLSEATVEAEGEIILRKILSRLDLYGPVYDSTSNEVRFRIDGENATRTPRDPSG
jgi:anti-sigma factor RsiW